MGDKIAEHKENSFAKYIALFCLYIMTIKNNGEYSLQDCCISIYICNTIIMIALLLEDY